MGLLLSGVFPPFGAFSGCKYKCNGCGKPHPEKDCYVLHPEKAPKGWKTPERRRQGRDRDKGNRERKRSQTRSGDRRDNRSNDRRGEPTKNVKRDKPPRVQKVDRDRRS